MKSVTFPTLLSQISRLGDKISRQEILKLEDELHSLTEEKQPVSNRKQPESTLSGATTPRSLSKRSELGNNQTALSDDRKQRHLSFEIPKYQPEIKNEKLQILSFDAFRSSRKALALKASNHPVFRHIRDKIAANLKSLQLQFLKQDRDMTERVSKADLARILERNEILLRPSELEEVMRLLDPERTGTVDYNDFLGAFTITAMASSSLLSRPATGAPQPPGTAGDTRPGTTAAGRGVPPASRQAAPREPLGGKDLLAITCQANDFVRHSRAKFQELFALADPDGTGSISMCAVNAHFFSFSCCFPLYPLLPKPQAPSRLSPFEQDAPTPHSTSPSRALSIWR